jgi:hypothetical protein
MSVFVTPVSAGMLPTVPLALSQITGVPNSIETTILSYTILGEETIGDIVLSGTDYARFNIYLNTVLTFVVRSGPSRQANLQLQRPWQLATGDVIDVKVIHYNTAGTADFEATVMGV